jgi:hypothetical protein
MAGSSIWIPTHRVGPRALIMLRSCCFKNAAYDFVIEGEFVSVLPT